MHKRKFRALICSMLLGDGCLHNAGVQRRKTKPGRVDDVFFCMNHSSQQADYATWKANLLNEELAERKQDRKCTYSKSSKTDRLRDKTYTGLYVKLRWAEFFRHLYPRVYKGSPGTTKKHKDIVYLLSQLSSDLHTAIWFMDDGNEKRPKKKDGTFYRPFYRLFTYGFGDSGNELIKNWFIINYGVNPTIEKDNSKVRDPNVCSYLRFTVEDSRKLFLKFAEYYCQTESMRNKFWLSFKLYSQTEKVTSDKDEDIVHSTT